MTRSRPFLTAIASLLLIALFVSCTPAARRTAGEVEVWMTTSPSARAIGTRLIRELETGGEVAAGKKALGEAIVLRERGSPETLAMAERLEDFARQWGVHVPDVTVPPVSAIPRSIEESIFGAGWRFLQRVDIDVRGFEQPFADGARNYQQVFDYYATHPEYAPLIAEWSSKGNGVYLIGAGKDGAGLDSRTRSLRENGYQALSYLDCYRLFNHPCPAELLGAFAGSAIEVVVLDSEAARLSRYVWGEAQITRAVRDGRPVNLRMTHDEFTNVIWNTAAGTAGAGGVGAAVYIAAE